MKVKTEEALIKAIITLIYSVSYLFLIEVLKGVVEILKNL